MEYANKIGEIYRNFRILEIKSDCLIGATGYKLCKIFEGKQIVYSELNDNIFSLLSRLKLARRLFRAEIHTFKTLKNNNCICVAKNGIFLKKNGNGKFEKVFHIVRGSRPMAICEDNDGAIFFGEYYNNKERSEVHIYGSFNSGKSWEIVYTFPPKTIRHIHSIQLDPFTGFLWIATGDEENECIIGFTRDRFRTIEIVKKGGQEYRTCNFLFLKDKIIYGTDSPYIENYIKAINRCDDSINLIQKVQGSVINACQIRNKCIISTTVEPSEINKDKNSYIWISEMGNVWHQIASFRKDIFNMTLFQYGNIRFPHYHTTNVDSLYFSGHALKKIDNHSLEFKDLSKILESLV